MIRILTLILAFFCAIPHVMAEEKPTLGKPISTAPHQDQEPETKDTPDEELPEDVVYD